MYIYNEEEESMERGGVKERTLWDTHKRGAFSPTIKIFNFSKNFNLIKTISFIWSD
jgi:hypothetical protein